MKNTTLKEQRNRRLRWEVKRAMERGGLPAARALERVLNRPLPRGFYLGVDSVIVMDRRRRAGKASPAKGSLRAAMWADLFEQIDRLLGENPRMSRVDAVCRVIATGTSRHGFCISRANARNILKHGGEGGQWN